MIRASHDATSALYRRLCTPFLLLATGFHLLLLLFSISILNRIISFQINYNVYLSLTTACCQQQREGAWPSWRIQRQYVAKDFGNRQGCCRRRRTPESLSGLSALPGVIPARRYHENPAADLGPSQTEDVVWRIGLIHKKLDNTTTEASKRNRISMGYNDRIIDIT